jgi:drug/metabolite transporter (DMT)-like permease
MLHQDTARHRRIGIGLVTLTTLLFATLDASAKWLVQSLPVFEVVWLRFLTHALITPVLLAPMYGRELLRMREPRLHLLRAAMLGTMTALNFWALQYLQLAETGAIQFSVPLLIALLSAWWLGERLDARRWAAIVVGFAGVLLVIRPGSHAFHPAILLSVGNALLYAAFNLLTRRMAATESPAATQWMSALGATVVIAPLALAQWQWPADAKTWFFIVLCGLCGGVGHFFVALAHRYASAATLGPFLYQQIVYMALAGWLVFGQVPDAFVVAGAVVVVSSGLYLLWLEMRRK